ncbi:MAG: thiamine pyrophosphate-binding protein [Chloroflexota bacterium]
MEGTGARILVESLRRAGVTTIFGVPGDTGVVLYDALYDARDHIRHILARDERSAAMMADAYARCANRVGVVEASSGGGTTYVVGGLGEPFAASVPLLVITSDIHRGSRWTGALTEIDQTRLFSAVTKWAATAAGAAEIPALVGAALTAATSGRPAPVSLVIPEDVLDEHAHAAIPDEALGPEATAVPRARTAAGEGAVRTAAEALHAARQPAIVAGGGIHLSEAWDDLARLAEEGGIPVATSIHGKGSLAESSPWSLGVVGANGARDYANAYLAAADTVLFVGTRANATDTYSYTCPPRRGPTVIGIDIEEERAGRNYPGSIRLAGDARTVLRQIARALPAPDPARRRRLAAWVAEQRASWQAAWSEASRNDPAWIEPGDVVRAIQEITGGSAIVVADPGTPTPYVAAHWEPATTGRNVIVPRGHGPMGYALPGAVGAALACPGRPVAALMGDGSFAMSCGELETACRLDLPISYVQFNNRSMGWIKMLQHLYLERRYFGVDLGPTDAAAVARGFGLRAAHADSLADFKEVFMAYHASGGPSFIDLTVPDETEAVPPVAPWHAALTGKRGRPVY